MSGRQSLADKGILLAYSRCHEREADLEACMDKDGYLDSNCLEEAIKAHYYSAKKSSIHPSGTERVAYLKKLKIMADKDGKVSPDKLKRLIFDCDDCQQSKILLTIKSLEEVEFRQADKKNDTKAMLDIAYKFAEKHGHKEPVIIAIPGAEQEAAAKVQRVKTGELDWVSINSDNSDEIIPQIVDILKENLDKNPNGAVSDFTYPNIICIDPNVKQSKLDYDRIIGNLLTCVDEKHKETRRVMQELNPENKRVLLANYRCQEREADIKACICKNGYLDSDCLEESIRIYSLHPSHSERVAYLEKLKTMVDEDGKVSQDKLNRDIFDCDDCKQSEKLRERAKEFVQH